VIHSLEGGGAERVLADLANHWAENGDRVSLITLSGEAEDKYSLKDNVRRVGLGVMRVSANPLSAVWNNFVRVRKLRQAIRESRAECVISFTETMNVLTLLACRRLRIKPLICERIDPRQHAIGRAWSWLRRLTYPHCAAAVAQTASVADFIRPLVRDKPVYVIPNAVEAPIAEPASEANTKSQPYIVSMGRLVRQKGFDLLIEAFQQVAAQHREWKLCILGEGPELSALKKQAAPLGDRVQFCGWQANPTRFLQDAELFALTSRYEGFPNALLEAMAYGVAVVSFDCPSGPREIIRDDVDGLLIAPADVGAMAQALDRLMSDEAKRRGLGETARQVVDRFSTASFYERWEAVLRHDDPGQDPATGEVRSC
jgi:glycosyltransferase involved in cell wall biosynthesis